MIFFLDLFIIKGNDIENDSQLEENKGQAYERMISLINAPSDNPLKIVDVLGGHGVRRRLLALGFHKNDIIELDSRSILRGPVLVRNLSSDTSIALGRGVARKILVEIVDERK